MRYGIVSIQFSNPDFLIRQVEAFNRFTDADFICVDNSKDLKGIRYHAHRLGVEYLKTYSSDNAPSISHSFACQMAYIKYRKVYDYLFFVDHDLFPLEDFTLDALLNGKLAYGLPQVREGIEYIWPGCFVIDTKIDKELVNFAPLNVEGVQLDTGGGLYNITDFERIGEEYHSLSTDDFYSILGGKFMHFIKGSNWNNAEDHQERLNKLFNIYENRTNTNSNGEVH